MALDLSMMKGRYELKTLSLRFLWKLSSYDLNSDRRAALRSPRSAAPRKWLSKDLASLELNLLEHVGYFFIYIYTATASAFSLSPFPTSAGRVGAATTVPR